MIQIWTNITQYFNEISEINPDLYFQIKSLEIKDDKYKFFGMVLFTTRKIK